MLELISLRRSRPQDFAMYKTASRNLQRRAENKREKPKRTSKKSKKRRKIRPKKTNGPKKTKKLGVKVSTSVGVVEGTRSKQEKALRRLKLTEERRKIQEAKMAAIEIVRLPRKRT